MSAEMKHSIEVLKHAADLQDAATEREHAELSIGTLRSPMGATVNISDLLATREEGIKADAAARTHANSVSLLCAQASRS